MACSNYRQHLWKKNLCANCFEDHLLPSREKEAHEQPLHPGLCPRLAEVLRGLGLEAKCGGVFAQQQLDIAAVRSLTEADWRELRQIPMGHRITIRNAFVSHHVAGALAATDAGDAVSRVAPASARKLKDGEWRCSSCNFVSASTSLYCDNCFERAPCSTSQRQSMPVHPPPHLKKNAPVGPSRTAPHFHQQGGAAEARKPPPSHALTPKHLVHSGGLETSAPEWLNPAPSLSHPTSVPYSPSVGVLADGPHSMDKEPAQCSFPARSNVVLLLGETGCGKSTFINMLCNYFLLGSPPNRLKVAIRTKYLDATENFRSSETDVQNRGVSQTNSCEHYDFVHRDSRRFKFIDSPGLSDTRGPNQDDLNITSICRTAEQVGSLTAIIVLINGTGSRNTVVVRNALTRLKGSLPDVLLNNIIVVWTNCTTISKNNDTILSFTPTREFCMENLAFSTDPTRWQAKDVARLNLDWDDSMKTIRDILDVVSGLAEQATTAFGDMRVTRDSIKAQITGAMMEVKKLQALQDSITAKNTLLQRLADDQQKYAQFTKTEQQEYTELVNAPYHSTLCTKCQTVCHDDCGLEFTDRAGHNIFRDCACMDGGQSCTVCEGHCPFSSHFHDKKKVERKTKTVETILYDVKAQYDRTIANAADAQSELTDFQRDLQAVQGVLRAKQGEIHQLCEKLQGLCKGFNFVDELTGVIDSLVANARTILSVEARSEAEALIRSLKTMVNQFMAQCDQGPLPNPSAALSWQSAY